ncbi:hypothetical protein BJ741DRAFT_610078 [Chytriomyces cf. hyalinus JEL632]|nr:hypothetical protein BJ741DRAFT_610078 [Chytriomyces cf. hyalinus JEL632]
MESRQFELIILTLSIVYLAVQCGACAYRRYLSATTSSTVLLIASVTLLCAHTAAAYLYHGSLELAGDLASSGGYAVSSIMLYSLLEHRLYLLMSTSSVRQRNRTYLLSLIAVLGLASALASVLQVVDLSKGAVQASNKDLEIILLITEAVVSTAVLWLTASSVKSLVEGFSQAGPSVGVYRVILYADTVRLSTVLLVNVVLIWDEWGGPRVLLLDTVKMGVTSLCLVAPTATSLQRLFSCQMQQTDGLPMGSVAVALPEQS